MGNCWSFQLGSAVDHRNSSTAPNPNNRPDDPGSIQFSAGLSNKRLIQNSNSTSLGHSSHSGGISRFFGPSSSNNYSTGNNTSTSLWGSENSQASRVRDEEERGQILDVADLREFTLADLKAATRNFRADSLLGEGDLSEINFLGRLSHPNLVKLLGFGRHDGKLFLVYEFMPRGSLDNHLFGRGANTYAAKLSDFGLAKSVASPDQSHVSTQVVGTYGYAAPEYIVTGRLYVKSDVYGFGILLVELLTGKRITGIMKLCEATSLRDWVKRNLLNRGFLRSTMDAKLEGKYPSNLALQMVQLALKCIQTEPKVRPSMKEVLERLEQIEAANEKPADNRRQVNRSRVVQQHGREDVG
ncbi:hypothetical protein ACSQ67_006549 [Phaseolus vulgaris]